MADHIENKYISVLVPPLTPTKQKLHFVERIFLFRGSNIDVQRSNANHSISQTTPIPPTTTTDKVREIHSNLTSVHGFLSTVLYSPSVTLSSEMSQPWVAATITIFTPQSFGSKSNFCANHRGLIKILIETKHK